MGYVIGVDGARCRSGGAIAHLKGIVSNLNEVPDGIDEIHLWAPNELLDQIQDDTILIKHGVPSGLSVFKQILWQMLVLPFDLRRLSVDVLFNTDAASFCLFPTVVTLSQDMLSFEPGESERYSWFRFSRWRLEGIKYLQRWNLNRSVKSLFLTGYAKKIICPDAPDYKVEIVPHGVDESFRLARCNREQMESDDSDSIECLYVSDVDLYKHQWHVVEAIYLLRERTGFDFRLTLVGGGASDAIAKLNLAIDQFDEGRNFVNYCGKIPHNKLPGMLCAADVFIFASSCENLPITLLEAMAVGVPIACSDRGPMPDILCDSSTYFDPEQPKTIADAVEELVCDDSKRTCCANSSLKLSEGYSWDLCSNRTWKILLDACISTSSDKYSA